MKKIIKLMSAVLAMIFVLQSTIIAGASLKSTSAYTGSTYTHQTRFDELERFEGIDVSEHNGNVDFAKVKKAGIDFVFVRVGWTGYTRSKHSLNYDKRYVDNIKNALKNGLGVGVYWYSQALTEAEARAEANMLTKVLGDYNITLPVVMDYEFAGVDNGRLDYAWRNKQINKAKMTANALAFLDVVNKAGYDGCLYACKSFLTTQLDASQISQSYKIWLAHYTTNTDYTGDFEFWQYSSSGRLATIGTNKFDVNFWYYDNKAVKIEDYIYTGKPITPQPVIMADDVALVEGTDYELSYKNNTNVGTGQITATGINDYEGQQWLYKFRIKPDRVNNLKLDKSRTTESISVKWSSVVGATSYKIYVKNNTQGTSFTRTSTSASAVIDGLTTANSYTIKVRAIRNGYYGDYSAALTAHTVPTKVTGLKTSARTTSTVTLSWDKKVGASGYKIYLYYPSKNQTQLVGTVNGQNTTSFKISNRKQGVVYYYKVAAFVRDSGIGDRIGYLSSHIGTTAKPNTQKITSISSPSKKKLKLSWNGTSCSGYQVQWSTYKNFSNNYKSVFVGGKTKSTTLSTYYSKKRYYVRVRAYKTVNNTKIYGSWSSAKYIKVK